MSKNVIVISTNPISKRLDYIGVNFTTTNKVLSYNFPKVYVENNYFNENKDKAVYQLYAERNSETKTYPQYILDEIEVKKYFGKEVIENLYNIEKQIEVFDFTKADNIRFKGKKDIIGDCERGAIRLGIDLESEPYKSRFEREINLLISKGFEDYILVVAEIISKGKLKTFFGPGRGSSGGSLVCYLLGITTFNPIKFDLMFERFVDPNRGQMMYKSKFVLKLKKIKSEKI